MASLMDASLGGGCSDTPSMDLNQFFHSYEYTFYVGSYLYLLSLTKFTWWFELRDDSQNLPLPVGYKNFCATHILPTLTNQL
jgi:hypothetical protein